MSRFRQVREIKAGASILNVSLWGLRWFAEDCVHSWKENARKEKVEKSDLAIWACLGVPSLMLVGYWAVTVASEWVRLRGGE